MVCASAIVLPVVTERVVRVLVLGASGFAVVGLYLVYQAPDLALTQLETLLQDDPTDLDARILRIEAMLAVSEFDAAAQEAAALRDEYPDDAWGWILGAAAERVRGRPALEWVERADELASDCTCKRTEQRAVAWVRTVGQGPRVLPRSRVDISEEVDLRAP